MLSTCRIVWCLSACNKITSSRLSFLRDYRDIIKRYFGYIGDTWPRPSKTVALTCRNLFLSANKKSIWSLKLLHLQWNPAIWLAKNIWAITPEQEFYQAQCLRWKVKNQKNFHFVLCLGKVNHKIFKKCKNPVFLGAFCRNLGRNELSTKIRLCHFLTSIDP